MPIITPLLPEHEVLHGRLDNNLMQAWSEYELIAKHCHLYRKMKQMLGELVALLKQQKLSLQLFNTYSRCTNKGIPKASLPDDTKRNNLLRGAKVELKTYRAFHKRKMERFKEMIQTVKTYLCEWQALRNEVCQRLADDFWWQIENIPNEVNVQMHLSFPKWELCNRCLVEQIQQKYNYTRAHSTNDKECNEWIVAYE